MEEEERGSWMEEEERGSWMEEERGCWMEEEERGSWMEEEERGCWMEEEGGMLDGGCRGEIMVDRLRIKSAQVAMREKLKKLTDDSYLCDDLETLQQMTVALENMTQTIEQLCKRENGLILNKLDDIVMYKKHDLRALPVRKHKSKLSRKRKWTQGTVCYVFAYNNCL